MGQYVTLRVARQHFALDAAHIRALLPMRDLIPLESAQVLVLGIAALRGARFPVIDLSARLGIPRGSRGRRPCIVAVEVRSSQGPCMIGFIADRVSEVVTTRDRDVQGGILRNRGRRRRILDPAVLACDSSLLDPLPAFPQAG